MFVFIRSIFLWIAVCVSLVIFFPLLFFLQASPKGIQLIQQAWEYLLVFVGGVKTNIQGMENLDPSRSYVIMSNHQSYFDIFLLCRFPVVIRWMAKKELFNTPVLGGILRWIKAIEVDRGNRTKSYRSLKLAAERIRNGSTVLIFPEGTRSEDGELLLFNMGGFSLAIMSGAPILPITIKGSNKIMPKGSLRVFPGLIKVFVHSPIETAGLTQKDRDQLQKKIKEIFQNDLKDSSSFPGTFA